MISISEAKDYADIIHQAYLRRELVRISDNVIHDAQNPDIEILLSEYIEPTFSEELIKNSIYALASSLLVIAVYVWIRFDWQFAASGIFALLHDVFVAIGFMSLFNIEFNLTMIAALLLIAGYSINDTIVLFDRLRSLTSNEENKDNFETLSDKLSKLGSKALLKSLRLIENDDFKLLVQDNKKSTRAPKIKKEMLRINWSWKAEKINNWIRGLSPFPGMYTVYKGKKLKIFKLIC
mgnify:CR=1 FL=1